MKNIAIYGAGGFGRETALLIQQINKQDMQWNLLGFFDDGLPKGSRVDGLVILGGMKEALQYTGAITIAVADPSTREKISGNLLKNPKLEFPSLIHPHAQLGSEEFNTIGRGCIITAGVIMTTHITLGDFCIINLSATVGHDVILGAFTTIMPGCSISGNVNIGQRVLLGTGARMLQNINIGDHATIGAGAVVTKHCPPNETWVGVPASKKIP